MFYLGTDTHTAQSAPKEHSAPWILIVAFGLALGLAAAVLYIVAHGIIKHLFS
jgi:hypothetical protein